MVVAGPRHSIASSALPSRAFETHHYQTHHNEQEQVTISKGSVQTHHHEQQQVTISKGSVGTAQQFVPTAYAFVYGTLKKGFSNYWLMEDVVAKGHARFLGTARTKQKFPMVCGPYQVPFLIDLPSAGYHVRGELYEVDGHAIERLDELEGVSKGNYVRRSIILSDLELQPSVESLPREVMAQVYFASPSYASRMVGAPHIEAFTEKEYATYVRRKDRPQNRTFLQHIEHWIKSQEVTRRNVHQCSKVLQ